LVERGGLSTDPSLLRTLSDERRAWSCRCVLRGGASEPEPAYDESNDAEVLADVVADTLAQGMHAQQAAEDEWDTPTRETDYTLRDYAEALEHHVDDRMQTAFPSPDEYAWQQADQWQQKYDQRQAELQNQRELAQAQETEAEFHGLLTNAANTVGVPNMPIPDLQAQFMDVLDRAQANAVLEQAFQVGYSEHEIADAMSNVAPEQLRQDTITRNVLNGPRWNKR
jgi:hypothetical protein